jgi:hypothetical protein
MNITSLTLVNFPAVIKLYADDELMLVANELEFKTNQNLRNMYFQPQDILIDNSGHVFNIHNTEQLALSKTDYIMRLDEVIKLVQLHLSNHGTCCISKFSANSIQDALNFL